MFSSSLHRWVAAAAVALAGVVVLVVSVSALAGGRDRPAAPVVVGQLSALDRLIDTTQAKLRSGQRDAEAWARLGSAYVEKARLTAEPSYYTKAQGALETSLRQQPEHNGAALIGMGALANARHDFAAARDWGLQAQRERPDSAEVYGVLADAQTQLGDTGAATDAVQRMLDLRPGVASFTRAAYDLELHGRTDEAHSALERALADAVNPGDAAYCRYYLGELAFDRGDLDGAEEQYEQGLTVDPGSVILLQGRAKIATARGRTEQALDGYRRLVERAPLPQYLHEYAVLLLSAGRSSDAAEQFDLLDDQQKLQAAAGASDDLTASAVAADRGDPVRALQLAEAEWGRRHNIMVADALAWALHLNGRDVEALAYADQAAALGWRHASLPFHRGMILLALGRTGEAAEALRLAVGTNPYFSPLHGPAAQRTLATLGSGR